jgi:class 3 adenylate cyclase
MVLPPSEESQIRHLRFDDPAVEAAFHKDTALRSIRYVRGMGLLLLALVLLGVLLYNDHDLPPQLITQLLILRFGLVLPLVVTVLALTYWDGFARWMSPLLIVTLLAFGVSLVAAPLARLQTPGFESVAFVSVDLMLFILAVYTLSRLSTRAAAVVCLPIIALYMAVAERFGPPTLSFSKLAYDLFFANLLGLSAAMALERYMRRSYLQQRTIEAERERADQLLLNILPPTIAARLKENEQTIADLYDDVTVLFADIEGFTRLAEKIGPGELVALLNELFSAFDFLAEQHGLEKIKTMGDEYMAVSGLPEPNPRHTEAAAEMALGMRAYLADYAARTGLPLVLRIGLHCGPVVAGVIGRRKFAYDLWGDTVNIASRMQSHGPIGGGIQVSEAVCERLQDRYDFIPRGPISIKNKGKMPVYLLTGCKTPPEGSVTDEEAADRGLSVAAMGH